MVNMNQIASAAYGATQKIATGNGPAAEGVEGVSFSDLLEQGIDKAIGAQHESENLSERAIVGKADLNDVILATQNADVALNTVIAIRDKVVAAYQDILRMAI